MRVGASAGARCLRAGWRPRITGVDPRRGVPGAASTAAPFSLPAFGVDASSSSPEGAPATGPGLAPQAPHLPALTSPGLAPPRFTQRARSPTAPACRSRPRWREVDVHRRERGVDVLHDLVRGERVLMRQLIWKHDPQWNAVETQGRRRVACLGRGRCDDG